MTSEQAEVIARIRAANAEVSTRRFRAPKVITRPKRKYGCKGDLAAQYAKDTGCTLTQAALKFALSRPTVAEAWERMGYPPRTLAP